MPDRSYITPAMRAAIGGTLEQLDSYPITEGDVRRWLLAVYHPEVPPRSLWDPEISGPPGERMVVPQDLNPFAWMSAEPRGHLTGFREDGPTFEALLGIDEVSPRRTLNGGLTIEYGAPMRVDDVIRSTTTLASYDERRGRLGLMLFTRTITYWENQTGDHVKTTHLTHIRY